MIPIQIKCSNVEIPLSEMLEVESNFYQAFDRFQHIIREAQLTLGDANGPKGGVDKQCTIQLRFHPRGIAVVKSNGTSFTLAASIACNKMQQVAARKLSKRKGRQLKITQTKVEGVSVYGN